jgi:hypothetical protein
MWSLIANIAGGTLGEWVKSKGRVAQEQAKARASAVTNGIPGWSDNWLVIVWSFPFVACYMPGGGEYAAAALAHIDALPEWYVNGFFMVTGAVFGLDKFIKWKK